MAAPKGNKYALGNNGGKPPMYKLPEELEQKCFDYFKSCLEDKEKATITGLALFLGFCERKSLDDYSKKKEFVYIIKRAKLTVENSYENHGNTIDIFALKNMGWKDKQEYEHTGNVNTNHKVIFEDYEDDSKSK